MLRGINCPCHCRDICTCCVLRYLLGSAGDKLNTLGDITGKALDSDINEALLVIRHLGEDVNNLGGTVRLNE